LIKAESEIAIAEKITIAHIDQSSPPTVIPRTFFLATLLQQRLLRGKPSNLATAVCSFIDSHNNQFYS
jgi:hypothetical protein